MRYQIHVTPPAVADVEDLRAFIAESSEEAAERIMQFLKSAVETLADFPRRHPLAPETKTHRTDIRHMLVGNYRILFRVDDKSVWVLRVRHGAQAPLKPGELN